LTVKHQQTGPLSNGCATARRAAYQLRGCSPKRLVKNCVVQPTMKILKTIAALIPVVFLAGCTTSKVWYQQGRSLQETQQQLAECRAEKAEAVKISHEDMFSMESNNGHAPTKDLVKICMEANGYSLIDQNSLPKGAAGVPQ
jgi:hypothetical protein